MDPHGSVDTYANTPASHDSSCTTAFHLPSLSPTSQRLRHSACLQSSTTTGTGEHPLRALLSAARVQGRCRPGCATMPSPWPQEGILDKWRKPSNRSIFFFFLPVASFILGNCTSSKGTHTGPRSPPPAPRPPAGGGHPTLLRDTVLFLHPLRKSGPEQVCRVCDLNHLKKQLV